MGFSRMLNTGGIVFIRRSSFLRLDTRLMIPEERSGSGFVALFLFFSDDNRNNLLVNSREHLHRLS